MAKAFVRRVLTRFRDSTGQAFVASLSLLLFVLGCSGIGPAGINLGRPAYNAAIQNTSNEEMLLNIVRLRYRDTPFFLRVSGVAANASTTMGLNGNAQIPSSGTTVGVVGGTAFVEDNPTVTYSPLQGEDFVTHLLTPVRIETLRLLIETGWSIDRVLRLCVQRLGDVPNAPSASGPSPDHAPTYERFRRVSRLLRRLEKRGAISFSVDPTPPYGLVLNFRENEANSEEALEIAEILGLSPGSPRFILTSQREVGEDGRMIPVVTRSLMGSLFYLSQAVVPPPRHVEKGWVTVTRHPDGSAFAWDGLMDGLFKVRAESAGTSDAFLSTKYLGHVFSIDQSDLDTKATFVLLNQLFALRAGASRDTGPLLTLPVSR